MALAWRADRAPSSDLTSSAERAAAADWSGCGAFSIDGVNDWTFREFLQRS